MLWYWYEIFLGSDYIRPENWQNFFSNLQHYLGHFSKWKIFLYIKCNTVHYYLVTAKTLPGSLEIYEFMLKSLPEPPFTLPKTYRVQPFDPRFKSLPLILHKIEARSLTFSYLECRFSVVLPRLITSSHIMMQSNGEYVLRRLVALSPSELLSIDFSKTQHLRYKKIPKYLDSEKSFRLLRPISRQTLLQADTFPYGADEQGINLDDFDFAKHSLVIGSSGSGKSCFLSILASRLYETHAKDYKVIIIDPHDALKNDLGEVLSQQIIDFRTPEQSIDLFLQKTDNINVSVELMLETFKTLIGDSYNGRLERVLRHSIYLLLLNQTFTFGNLRQVLSDVEYRNTALRQLGDRVPSSTSHFFLTEFQELRSQAYNIAFAPIIAFIDEMQMVPVMDQNADLASINKIINDNFLTVFSLSRLFLGDKPTRVIAGLLMQQIFLFAQARTTTQHLFLIIDEVAVVENPILMRFLSEMRKYNVSVILAGQYFGQISSSLRTGILANVSNYYIFRVSYSDADLLRQNLQIKLIGAQDQEDEKKLFTGLKARECLVQICSNGEPYSLFKAHTPDHHPRPNLAIPKSSCQQSQNQSSNSESDFVFSVNCELTLKEIMQQNSTNRKPLKQGKAS